MTTTTPRQWFVRRSLFPFARPGAALGVVEATGRREAERLGIEQFGAPIVVEPVLARDLAALERAVANAERRLARSRSTVPRPGRRPDGDGEVVR